MQNTGEGVCSFNIMISALIFWGRSDAIVYFSVPYLFSDTRIFILSQGFYLELVLGSLIQIVPNL